jgi:hypothetical protein
VKGRAFDMLVFDRLPCVRLGKWNPKHQIIPEQYRVSIRWCDSPLACVGFADFRVQGAPEGAR